MVMMDRVFVNEEIDSGDGSVRNGAEVKATASSNR
jgi:hypothetical protein